MRYWSEKVVVDGGCRSKFTNRSRDPSRPPCPAPLFLKLDLSDVYQTGVSHLIPEIKKREAENKPDRLEAGSVRESADLECEEQI